MNEVGAEWDVNRRDTASHEIDGMNETRSTDEEGRRFLGKESSPLEPIRELG